jgi:hypothetical protein
MRDSGLEPSLILLPINYGLLQALSVRMRASAADMSQTAVSAAHAPKFNGVFDGVPVIDDPNLENRVLIIDLLAVRMEERPTPGEVGVEPHVRAFDAEEAAQFVEQYPQVVQSLPEDERIPYLQEHVLLEVLIGWRISLQDAAAVRALNLPEDLRRDG